MVRRRATRKKDIEAESLSPRPENHVKPMAFIVCASRKPTWAERPAAVSGRTPELCHAGADSSGRVRAGAPTPPRLVLGSSRSLATRETRRDRRYQSQ